MLCKNYYEEYLKKPNVGNAKKCFKDGIVMAYKLFYVGCSRARKNLTVIVEDSKITEFREDFINKIKAIGFVVK